MKSDALARAPRAAFADLTGQARMKALNAARFGRMDVIASDRGSGRLYRCLCGHEVWSSWGHAEHHANTCPAADVPGAVREARRS
jgi:hypothetical protein